MDYSTLAVTIGCISIGYIMLRFSEQQEMIDKVSVGIVLAIISLIFIESFVINRLLVLHCVHI